MTYEDDRDEGEIRRRAAWLLGMLAVVAALIAVLMVFFLRDSNGSGSNNAAPDPNYGVDPSVSASATGGSSSSASGPATDSSSAASSSSGATSSGPPPEASCPSSDTCVVKGDISGTVSAINDLRAQHDLSPVQATINNDADQCAVTRGDDCPQSFVWVHVDDLSGQAVVSAVQGFHGTDNLLDGDATKFAIGWAYDPGSKTAYCAVIRES